MSADPDLVTAGQILVAEGVLDAFGHVSRRDAQDPSRFWLSTAVPPSAAVLSDFQLCDPDGEPVAPTGAPLFSERVIHAAIYAARPDVGAIVHHHAPALLPFCVGAGPLYPVSQTGAFLGGPVPLWDSADAFGATNMLVTTAEQAASMTRGLGAASVVLMRGHGVTVVGRDLHDMTFRAVYSAREAELFLRLAPIAPVPLSAGEIALAGDLKPAAIERGWAHWVQGLGGAR